MKKLIFGFPIDEVIKESYFVYSHWTLILYKIELSD